MNVVITIYKPIKCSCTSSEYNILMCKRVRNALAGACIGVGVYA